MTNKLHHYTIAKGNDLWDCISEKIPKNAEEKKLEPKEIFDYYIKQSFEEGYEFLGEPSLKLSKEYGFCLSSTKQVYDRYFSKEMRLEELLSDDIRECYEPKKTKKTTSGNEFRSGKFYSVASSSRFAVSSFTEELNGKLDYIKRINGEEIKEAKFEYDAPIAGIPKERHCPQLDFFFKTNKGTYFIEAKCHEIFDSHKSIRLSPNYKGFLNEHNLSKSYAGKIRIDRKGNETEEVFLSLEGNKEKNRFLLAEDFDCKLKTYHFDFKQFLCHLMGILSYAEKHKSEEIYFYYLVYKNELYKTETESKIYEELEAEVKEVFRVFGKRFSNIHFGLCYNNEYNTLKELKPVDWGN